MKKIILAALLLGITALFTACPREESIPQAAPTEVPAVLPHASSSSSSYAARTSRPADASKAPDFSVTAVDGSTMKLSDYLGKIVILDFWATWCPPCRMEIPHFIAISSKYKKDGVVVLGLAIDQPAKVKNFMKNNSIKYQVAVLGQNDQSIPEAYGGIRGIPTTFVIDKEGYAVRQYVGYRDMGTFEKDIADLK